MSRREEYKDTENLRKPSSGMASGKVFAESNPPVNNSGNDRIIIIKQIIIKNIGIDLLQRKIRDQL